MTTFEPEMRSMADAIAECAKLVQRAVSMLSDISSNAAELNEIGLQITHLEGNADDIYDRGLELLYQKAKGGEALEFIRDSEIYKHLEDTMDSLDDVGDEIEGIAMALGTLIGGWRIVRTMGSRITRLKPVQGFCAETAGAATLYLATSFGVPVSTTHTITGAITGVGAAKRVSAVRWGVAGSIVIAWIITLPAAGFIGALFYALAKAVS
jgi:hypothetical protein